MLIIICGLPGTGKTTVAKKIAIKTGGVLLRTDVIRKTIGKERYSQKEKQKVYEEMFKRAREFLREGKTVVLDATFAKKKNRKLAQEIAKEKNSPFWIIETVCDEKIVKERLSKRVEDESEATFKQYLEHKKFFEPLIERHFIIDTTQNIEKQLKNLSQLWPYVKN